MAEAIAAGQLATDARVLGIAFDGTGAGTDGTIWGGEFLVASLGGFDRAAHLRTWALPGGGPVRDARRNAFALLSELGLLEHPGAGWLLDSLDEQTRSVTATMIERGINSPRTSSMGRLFDGAAAILGICDKATYEGEPAIRTRSRRPGARSTTKSPIFPTTTPAISTSGPSWLDGSYVLDQKALFVAILEGIESGAPADRLALDFHVAVARSSARIASDICVREGIDTVALSAACSVNRLLLQLLTRELKSAGLAYLGPPHRTRQ